MIIGENDSKATRKAPGLSQGLHPSRVPPPAYEPPRAMTGPSQQPLLIPPPATTKQYPPRESPAKRFIRAFLVAVLICILLSALMGSVSDAILGSHRNYRWGEPVRPGDTDGDTQFCEPKNFKTRVVQMPSIDLGIPQGLPWFPGVFPIPKGSKGEFQTPAGRHPSVLHVHHASYTLPATAELLYFVTRGSHAQGEFHIEPLVDADEVTIDVDLMHWNKEVLDSVKMCTLQRKRGNAVGFGIYTPVNGWKLPGDRQFIIFNVTVKVPLGDFSSIVALESLLHNFGIYMGPFGVHSYMEWIDIQTSNGKVAVESLAAHNISMKSSNGAISGHYFSDSSITLKTTNAKITATIDLLNEKKKLKRNRPTQLSLSTTNDNIKADIGLAAVRSDDRTYPGSGGSFNAYVHTTNGKLDANVTTAPLRSTLILDASTDNSPISAFIDRTYEGSFSLASSNAGSPRLQTPVTTDDDPEGKGRSPILQYTKVQGNHVEGTFRWGWSGRKETLGSISLQTSNGPAALVIT